MRIRKELVFDESERLNSIDEYRVLTDKQKQMVYEHVTYPELTKSEIAKKLGQDKATVYAFFHSKKWDLINSEMARQQLRELVQLSVKTLRSSMLNGTPAVKLDAATRVLVNAELLRSPHGRTINKTDNKMIVLLEDRNFGNSDSLQPAPATEGSPRLSDTVSNHSGGSAVGQDDVSH